MVAYSLHSFVISFADLGLPAAGAAQVTADTFLFLPPDIVIDRVFMALEGAGGTVGAGSATIGLVQSLGDQSVAQIVNQRAFDGSETGPVELLPSREHMEVGRPVYCRVVATCPTQAGTPWYLYAGLQLQGTIHFLVDAGDDNALGSQPQLQQ
jgi:hypothetical protein